IGVVRVAVVALLAGIQLPVAAGVELAVEAAALLLDTVVAGLAELGRDDAVTAGRNRARVRAGGAAAQAVIALLDLVRAGEVRHRRVRRAVAARVPLAARDAAVAVVGVPVVALLEAVEVRAVVHRVEVVVVARDAGFLVAVTDLTTPARVAVGLDVEDVGLAVAAGVPVAGRRAVVRLDPVPVVTALDRVRVLGVRHRDVAVAVTAAVPLAGGEAAVVVVLVAVVALFARLDRAVAAGPELARVRAGIGVVAVAVVALLGADPHVGVTALRAQALADARVRVRRVAVVALLEVVRVLRIGLDLVQPAVVAGVPLAAREAAVVIFVVRVVALLGAVRIVFVRHGGVHA